MNHGSPPVRGSVSPPQVLPPGHAASRSGSACALGATRAPALVSACWHCCSRRSLPCRNRVDNSNCCLDRNTPSSRRSRTDNRNCPQIGIIDRRVVIKFVSESEGHFKAVVFRARALVIVKFYVSAAIAAVAVRIITIADAATRIVIHQSISHIRHCRRGTLAAVGMIHIVETRAGAIDARKRIAHKVPRCAFASA